MSKSLLFESDLACAIIQNYEAFRKIANVPQYQTNTWPLFSDSLNSNEIRNCSCTTGKACLSACQQKLMPFKRSKCNQSEMLSNADRHARYGKGEALNTLKKKWHSSESKTHSG